MSTGKVKWQKGRGKLGMFEPLLGTWQTEADSPAGPVRCTRTFARVLGKAYVQLSARWELPDRIYEEIALFGVGANGRVSFWSFTSDGKHAEGVLADVSDVHAQAFGFEAEMPAGLARQIYWPDESEGFHWAVEAKNKSGWKRFTEHHYRRA